jgi:hypothetical protein
MTDFEQFLSEVCADITEHNRRQAERERVSRKREIDAQRRINARGVTLSELDHSLNYRSNRNARR